MGDLPWHGHACSLVEASRRDEPLGDPWPGCADDLTPEVRAAMEQHADADDARSDALIERKPMEVDEAMAAIVDPVDGVDLIITATTPDVAFDADGRVSNTFGVVRDGVGTNGEPTSPADLHGKPAISIPAGTAGGLPVGLHVISRHHTAALQLDVAGLVERERPRPPVAPAVSPGQAAHPAQPVQGAPS